MREQTIHSRDLSYIHGQLGEKSLEFANSTVLVTGCGGFLGYYLMHYFAEYAKELGLRKLIGLDNFILSEPQWLSRLKQNPVVSILKWDITKQNIGDVPGASDVTYVIHMASIASPTFYRRYPLATIDANIWGLRSLLDFYLKRDLKGFLFFSSSEVYGDPPDESIPTKEDYRGNVSCNGPRSCYDESKRFGETLCGVFSREFNFQVSVARPFNNYGPGMRLEDQRVPADFAKAIIDGRDIEIFSNGNPTRTFCYVADAIIGYLKVILYRRFDAFNIGTDTPEITITQLAEIYKKAGREIFGYDGRVIYKRSTDQEYLLDNPKRRCPDISKARELLAYSPTIEIDEGIYRYLTFLKEQRVS